MLAPAQAGTRLEQIYNNRASLAAFGVFFFATGLLLLMSKIRKWRNAEGWSLFLIYNAFFFSFLITWVGFGFAYAWGNMIGAIIVGGLYLRWKYHIYYYDPMAKKLPRTLDKHEPVG